MTDILKIINTIVPKSGIEYHFVRNKKAKVTYPYFVGELVPSGYQTEDGKEQYTLILTGWTRDNVTNLYSEADKLETFFDPVEGYAYKNESNNIFTVGYFEGAQEIDSGEEGLYRIQVTIQILAWKGRL